MSSSFRKHSLLAAISLVSASYGVAAWAQGGADRAAVSASGGISTPSASTAVFQNPAGLAMLSRAAVDAHAFFPDSVGKDGDYGAGLLYGKGGYGLAAGGRYAPESKASAAYYGLAVSSQSLHFSLGAAGFTPVSPGGDTTFNLGLLIEPTQALHLGFTALGVTGDPNEFGLGVSLAASNDVDLVVDATVDQHFAKGVASPGIRIGNPQAAITVSYGLRVDTRTPFASTQIREGLGLGGGIMLGNSLHWQVYYNQLAKYATTLSIDL